MTAVAARLSSPLPLLMLLAARPAAAQGGARELHAELLLGSSWSLSTPLVIRLPGRVPVRLAARYSTRPWTDAPYYAYRVGGGTLSSGGVPAGLEAEEVHHKVYLENPRAPVEHFEVSHGYNLVTASAVRPAGRLAVRFGAGIVIAHAEGSVGGERVGGTRRTFLGGGYHVAGITAQLAVGRAWPLGRGRAVLYATPEGKLTASLARVPVGDAGGSAFVPNVAVHALGGLGLRYRDR
ncbi:MAG: hypothetical protein ACJ79S_03090 [Gemmatimonadaceae bacterium]